MTTNTKTQEEQAMQQLDALHSLTQEALQAAIDGYSEIADFHQGNAHVPRGYSRSASEVQLYRDVATMLQLVKDAMGEEGITSQEDWKMSKAMECLGLTWRW